MYLKLQVCLLVVLGVLVGNLGAATTTATNATVGAVTTAAALPAVTTAVPAGGGKSSTATAKPTTKAPVLCYTDKCTGPDACKNATAVASYLTATCISGICVTIYNNTQYKFNCATIDCDDEKSKAKGSEVLCCEKAKCNTYEAAKQSSSTRLRSDNIAICAWLVFFLLKLF